METSSSSGKNSSLDNSTAQNPAWSILEQPGISFASLPSIIKDKIARAFAPRIRAIAYHLKAKLPAHVELSDLIGAGTLGLMESLQNFQPQLGIPFESFADNRIRGAMLDELRRLDWYSRGLLQKIKKLEHIIRNFEQEHGYTPDRNDLASLTGQDLSSLESTLEALNSQIILSLDAVQEQTSGAQSSDHGDPATRVAFHDIIDKLALLINTLGEREQLVLSLYYTEDLNMKEIAATLDVTEGRISQMHSQALAKLKKMFQQRHGVIS